MRSSGREKNDTGQDINYSEVEEKKRLIVKIWVTISLLISGLLLIPWSGLLLFAALIGWPFVIFDEGWDFQAVMFSLMMLYPLFAAVFFLAARKMYSRRRYIWATFSSISPVIYALLVTYLWSTGES